MHIQRALTAAAAASGPRFAMYYDQWHTAAPPKSATAGITHVITAFAGTTLFNQDPVGWYQPFIDTNTLRTYFDAGTKVCMAIGGWGDTAGFSVGQKTDASRKLFARNVATTLDRLGYDCVGMLVPIYPYALWLTTCRCRLGISGRQRR